MRAQLTKAKTGMTQPTGWHYHVCEDQFVYVLNGWVELEFESGEMLRCEAGDSVYIPGGLKHNELRTSDDFEILEISTPAKLGRYPAKSRSPAELRRRLKAVAAARFAAAAGWAVLALCRLAQRPPGRRG